MNPTLARIAMEEAKKNYHGDTSAAISNLQPLLELFDVADDVTIDTLNADWSGAFAFLCAEEAGLDLPVRYPDPRVRGTFAETEAWVDYAFLPKINRWRTDLENIEVGDLVFPDVPEDKPALIGIVLSLGEDTMDLAIGNYHNHSAIIEHPRNERIRGFLRLDAE